MITSTWNGEERRAANNERRLYTVTTLGGHVKHCRRWYGRRKSDRAYPMLDYFDTGIVLMAILLVCLSVLDSIFTLTLISGGGSEVNPFMNYLLQHHGEGAFIIVKMLLTSIPAVLLVATGNLKVFGRFRARSTLGGFVGAYLALIVYELMLLSLMASNAA